MMRDELPLQYVLKQPAGSAAAELPLVVVMHGRGADANDLADLAPYFGNGLRVLFPNAPKPWEAAPGMTYGFSWFDGWPPQGGSFDDSRRLVLEFIEQAVRKFPTPPGKVVIAGFSQGALVALDIGFRTTEPVAGIVAMSGAIYEAELPDLDARKEQRVLIVHGSEDEVIPVIAARRTRRVLEEHGISPEYHEFPMGHQVSQESVAVVSEFIRKSLA